MTWTESTFRSFDGTELFYRFRRPSTPSTRGVIVLHRGHEHSGRVVDVVENLEMNDKWFFAFDLRGHGRSPGARGWAKSFQVWVQDLDAFAIHICTHHGLRMNDLSIIANSVGSVMAAAWVLDYAPGIRGMALAAPAFSIKLYVPFALAGLRLVTKFTDQKFVTSYVRSSLLTRDPVAAKAYDQDPLITKNIAVTVLVSLFDLAKRLVADAASIETPTLVISAGSDFIVRNDVQKKFFDRLSSPHKKFVSLPGFKHALFHEKDREVVLKEVREFLTSCYADRSRLLPSLQIVPRPHTVAEYKTLAARPTPLKALYFWIIRTSLQTLGKLSDGIGLGFQHGFDSAASLDYVYRNQASGRSWLGRIFDRLYLNAIGWRGVRIRKQKLKVALRSVMEDLNAKGETPKVIDIASGHGRYLFEAANEVAFPVELHLRDISQANLTNAKKLGESLGVSKIKTTVADAFQTATADDDQSNIGVVSGLFELFESNQMVHSALSDLNKNLQAGAYLIYTGQPWHPQLEFIARVLNSHRGSRWIMRRRVQAEMDALVTNAGFEKLTTFSDGLGIFTVSIARKPAEVDVRAGVGAEAFV